MVCADGRCARAPLCDGSLVLGEGGETQVGLDDAEVGEELLGLFILDAGGNDDVVARDPVDRGGDLVLVTGLERVENTEDLGGVPASRGGVGQDEADLLVGVNDEDGTDGESNALLVDVGGVLVVEPRHGYRVRMRGHGRRGRTRTDQQGV